MKIKYLDMDGKGKLFSFHQHDFQTKTIDDKFYMLDGGLSAGIGGYFRTGDSGKMEEAEIKEIIEDIRNSFTWGKNYDKDNNRLPKTQFALLKDLDSSHLCGILSYLNNKAFLKIIQNEIEDDGLDIETPVTNKNWHIVHEIFIQELDYRIKNNLI